MIMLGSRQKSNLQPSAYKADALPIAPREHTQDGDFVYGIEPLDFFGREIVYFKLIKRQADILPLN